MAQRRISGKRRSRGGRSGNRSGFLNDDTNIIQLNKDDREWFNLTSVRPSTSINLSNRASDELNPDSNVNEMELSENWHENLPQSDSFKLLKQAAEKNKSDTDGSLDINIDDITESESEKEFLSRFKKRAGIKAKLSKQHNDSTNVFIKALEKTTNTTKNLTSVVAHDSESSAPTSPTKKNNSASENNASNDVEDGTTHVIPKRKRAGIRSRLNQNKNDSTNVFFKALEDTTDVTKNITSVDHDSQVQASEVQRANVTTRSGSRLTVTLSRLQEHDISVNKNTPSKTQRQNKSTNESTLNKTQNQLSLRNKSIANESQNQVSSRSVANESENQISLRHESSLNETQDQEDSRNEYTTAESQYNVEAESEINNSSNHQQSNKSRSVKDKSNKLSHSVSINSPDKNLDSDIQKTPVSIRTRSRLSASPKTPIQKNSTRNTANKSNNQTKISSFMTKNQSAPTTRSVTGNTNDLSDVSPRNLTKSQISSLSDRTNLSQNDNRLSTTDKSRKRKKSVAEDITEGTNNYEQDEIRSKTPVGRSTKKAKSTNDHSENSTNKQMDLENERTNVSITRTRASGSPQKSLKKKSVTDKSKTNTTNKVVSKSPRKELVNKTFSNTNVTRNNVSISGTRQSGSPDKSQKKKLVLESSETNTTNKVVSKSPRKELVNKTSSNTNVTRSKSQVTMEAVSNSKAKETFEKTKQNLFSRRKENRAVDDMFDTGLESDGAISSFSKASDDIPHPLQSTLVPTGKPLSRLTIFNSRQSLFDRFQDTPPASTHSSRNEHQTRTSPGQEPVTENIERPPEDNRPPLLSRRVTEIPEETERSVNLDESQISARSVMNRSTRSNKSNRSNRSNRSRHSDHLTQFPDSTWEKVQKNFEAMAKKLEEEERKKKEIEREAELRKKKTQSELWRKILQRKKEAQKKAKPRKPVDKAYLVNGKLYKQPKLPLPQKWVTDKLYKHLWRCMEPKYHIRTRIKSEKFVRRLSDLAKVILRRKKYENYLTELDEILVMMARYGIIENRYDFYRFCSEFMPYSFRKKVVPMMLPGNVRNIPYDKTLTYAPILKAGSGSDSSDNEAGDKSGSEDDESSECESE